MKKIILGLSTVGLLVSSAYAYESVTGPVVKMEQWGGANAYYVKNSADNCVYKAIAGSFIGDEGRKTFNAIILTAMATGKNVTLTYDTLPACNGTAPTEAAGIMLVNE